jgi:hypothetical protein
MAPWPSTGEDRARGPPSSPSRSRARRSCSPRRTPTCAGRTTQPLLARARDVDRQRDPGLRTGEVARRRGDGRLFLVSLGFLAAAGFLGLHALATPKVLLDAPNGGFVLATPVGCSWRRRSRP